MPLSNEDFIKKAFQSGLNESQVRAAVAERNQRLNSPKAPTTPSDTGITGSNGPLASVAKYLFPRTIDYAQGELQKIGEGNFQGPTGQEIAASAAGPLGQTLLGSERQKKQIGAAGELASYVPMDELLGTASKVPGWVNSAFQGMVSSGMKRLTNPNDSNVLEKAKGTYDAANAGGITSGVTDIGLNKVKDFISGEVKGVSESLMNKVFRETVKQTKSSVKSGTTLGSEALDRSIKGSEQGILQKSVDKIDDLEKAVDAALKSSDKTVDINDILKTTTPLVEEYRKAGNEAAAKALENRVMAIWQQNGEKIPVQAANEIKRTLYAEVGNAYGAQGSEGVEGIKALARGIKEAIAEKVKAIQPLNVDLGVYGRIRDSMVDRIARSSRNGIGLKDTVMAAGGLAGAPASGGLTLLPLLLGKLGGTTTAQTYGANILNNIGNSIENTAIPSTLAPLMGLLGSSVIPSPNVPNGNENNSNNNANSHIPQSIPQNDPLAPLKRVLKKIQNEGQIVSPLP